MLGLNALWRFCGSGCFVNSASMVSLWLNAKPSHCVKLTIRTVHITPPLREPLDTCLVILMSVLGLHVCTWFACACMRLHGLQLAFLYIQVTISQKILIWVKANYAPLFFISWSIAILRSISTLGCLLINSKRDKVSVIAFHFQNRFRFDLSGYSGYSTSYPPEGGLNNKAQKRGVEIVPITEITKDPFDF